MTRNRRRGFHLAALAARRRGADLIAEELRSAARLAAIFREEDEEIDARLGENIMTAEYRCRRCGACFNVPTAFEAHERECGAGWTDALQTQKGETDAQ